MNIRKNYEMGVELNRIRHAEIIAEAEENRLAWELRGQHTKSWKQRLAVLVSVLNWMIPTLRVHHQSEHIHVIDEANLTPDVGRN